MNATILDTLNDAQRAAVSQPPGNSLVLAGAGSGKTRVLVHRIAWLLQNTHSSPYEILSVTFTNKAAHEMRGRIEQLLHHSVAGMWVGTFHGLSHRLLRAHHKEARLAEGFQIIDADDQLRIIKRIHKNLDLDEGRWPAKKSQWFVNHQKEEGRRASNVASGDTLYHEVMLRVYHAYEAICTQSDLVDFPELLLRSLELLQHNPELSTYYQQRFKHILVDEFQDTNPLQYAWLKQLAGKEATMMAVGDDDQSIYSWRGARIENITRFSTEYPNVNTIRLEQNYRSTGTILSAANAVITQNTGRMGKSLWTDGKAGEPITLYTAFNERDEAYYVVGQMQTLFRQGHSYSDMAVLYRSNAQSRILEERLIDANIPYRIYGGFKFFDRAEIKDAIAYLRLLNNRQDDAAFERVINTPPRGIGATTLAVLRQHAHETHLSLWDAAKALQQATTLKARAVGALASFMSLIDRIAEDTKNQTLSEQTAYALHHSTLHAHYQKDRSEKGLSRLENLDELLNATKQFSYAEDDEQTPLGAFLSHIALETGESQSEAYSDCVNLMTLHAAKGLEFSTIFIVGLEEGLFPHKMSSEDPDSLEEERRLCYVGMTRAKTKLYISHAETRRLHGMEKYHTPSRFIQEIPSEYVQAVRPTAQVRSPNQQYHRKPVFNQSVKSAGQTLHIGQRVMHHKFGPGIIVSFEGQSEHARVEVRFDAHGVKWLVASFAKLQSIAATV